MIQHTNKDDDIPYTICLIKSNTLKKKKKLRNGEWSPVESRDRREELLGDYIQPCKMEVELSSLSISCRENKNAYTGLYFKLFFLKSFSSRLNSFLLLITSEKQ